MAVGDSFAIRAYLSCRRDFDDIDLVFPETVSPEAIMALALGCSGEPEIIVPEPSGHFVRVKYIVPHLEKLGNDFRIDFHVGGIWHNGRLFPVDGDFFKDTTWQQVPFAGEDDGLFLPIPTLESLFVLKIVKFVGDDVVDVLLMLACDKVDLNQIVSRLSGRNESGIAATNLIYIENNLGPVLDNCSYKYSVDVSPEALQSARNRVHELMEVL
ncbi:MAG: hypothetical protein ACXQS5_03595 [Candidatus Methanospirareceae archaeon]